MQFCYYRDAGSHESQENISKTGTDASEATEGSEDVSVPVLAVSEEQAVAFRKNRNKRDGPCSQAHEDSPFFAQSPLDTAVIAELHPFTMCRIDTLYYDWAVFFFAVTMDLPASAG